MCWSDLGLVYSVVLWVSFSDYPFFWWPNTSRKSLKHPLPSLLSGSFEGELGLVLPHPWASLFLSWKESMLGQMASSLVLCFHPRCTWLTSPGCPWHISCQTLPKIGLNWAVEMGSGRTALSHGPLCRASIVTRGKWLQEVTALYGECQAGQHFSCRLVSRLLLCRFSEFPDTQWRQARPRIEHNGKENQS